jgi:hypothetical protein
VISALRVGEWDWARELLDEWLAIEPMSRGNSELHSDRAMFMAVRGDDPASDLAAEAALRKGVTDPQYESYGEWARAWAAFSAGDFEAARERAESAARITNYFRTLSWPLAARAALWLGDAAGARSILDAMEAAPAYGQALELDKSTLRAGLAALEGRGPEALAGYRDAIRGWRALGLEFDTALAAVELAAFLAPADRATADAEAAIEAGRQILARLEARPFIDRLAAALERPATVASSPATGAAQRAPTRTSLAPPRTSIS